VNRSFSLRAASIRLRNAAKTPRRLQADKDRWRLYRLTPKQFDARVLRSCGRCLICRKPSPKLEIDHDHATGKARGLLCGPCNATLGWIERHGIDEAWLKRAIAYTRWYQSRPAPPCSASTSATGGGQPLP